MTLDVLVILLMAIGLVVFIGEPIVRQATSRAEQKQEPSQLERLSLQKEVLYTAISDLDFDFQTSKVDERDYAALRQELEEEALQLLRRIDDVDPLAVLDNEIERQILVLRQQQPSQADAISRDMCPGCATLLRGGEHFCPSCGQPLLPS
jgi:hypothetical protein